MISHAFVELIKSQHPLALLNGVMRVPLELIAHELDCSQSFLSFVKSGKRKLTKSQDRAIRVLLDRVLEEIDTAEVNPEVRALINAIVSYGEDLT